MITKTIYEIKFLNEQGQAIKALTFDSEPQRDALYNEIDSIDHSEVPAGCFNIEKWSRTTAAPTPRRRSVISGRFKAVQ